VARLLRTGRHDGTAQGMLALLTGLQRAGSDDVAALTQLAEFARAMPRGDRSPARRRGLGDHPAHPGGIGTPPTLIGGKTVACQLVEASLWTLGGAIGRRYKPAQVRSRDEPGVPRLPKSPRRERSERKGRASAP
jgi:hypothetical protein